MKNRFIYTIILSALVMVSCKKEFTERPALDTPTVDNYYNTADQVRGATATMYGLSWFDFTDKALDCIGDLRSGNEFTWDNQYSSFHRFTTTATDPRLSEAWNAFYKVVGWSNVMIKTLEYKKSQIGDQPFLDAGIAEARFMRGVAYFYIGRIWGDAPIVTDPGAMAQSGKFDVPRHIQKDVFKFALQDFQAAEQGLPETDDKGRVTKYSAKGMMAKLYLYTKDYANARAKADEVIKSGKYSLFQDYAGMFNTAKNNNNSESLFALQHVISNEWGSQSTFQSYRAPGNLLVTGDGWSAIVPSLDLIFAYEPGDKRREWSIMEHGAFYPQWKPQRENNAAFNTFMATGYKYDTARATPLGIKNSTRSNIAKYVVGPGGAFGGGEMVQSQKTEINTYMLRYADVLLIYAEAVMGEAASTGDASALAAFNAVRTRAGLDPKTTITKDDILKERRVEFAFEGDYWYDIQRQGYAKAKQILEAQERGHYNDDKSINSIKITFNENQMYLPIPLSETTQNAKLAEPAVPYF